MFSWKRKRLDTFRRVRQRFTMQGRGTNRFLSAWQVQYLVRIETAGTFRARQFGSTLTKGTCLASNVRRSLGTEVKLVIFWPQVSPPQRRVMSRAKNCDKIVIKFVLWQTCKCLMPNSCWKLLCVETVVCESFCVPDFTPPYFFRHACLH